MFNKFPFKVIDLTHTIDPSIPSWSGACGFQSHIKLDYTDREAEVKFRIQKLVLHAGCGTHIDAPAHCVPNAKTIDELNLSDLIAPCMVIDISDVADENYMLSISDIKKFEEKYGTINPGSFVMVRTGWDRFWNDPEKYRNNYIFPSVSGDAAKYLLEREIVGLGIDTLSPDRDDSGYPVHGALLGAGKHIIENAANLSSMPPINSFILALPIKIKDGTEAPIRLIALVK